MGFAFLIPFFLYTYVMVMWKGTTLFSDPEAEALQQSTGRVARFDPLTANNFVLSTYFWIFACLLVQESTDGHQVPLIIERHTFLCWCFAVINIFGSFTSLLSLLRSLTIPPPMSVRVLRWCSIFFMICALQMLLAAAFWLVYHGMEQGNPGVSPV